MKDIPLPRQYDMNEYRMMEEFIYDLPAGRAQDALDAAIRGKVHSADLRIAVRL